MPLQPFLLPIAQTTGTRQLIDQLARTPLSEVVILVVVLTVLRVAIYPILANTPPHKRLGGFVVLRWTNEILDAVIYAAVFVFMVIRPFAIQAFLIPSGSMWPTLHVNDFIVANKAIYRYSDPKDGDIVVFRPPVTAKQPGDVIEDGEMTVDFIKRCIGGPGDLIEIRKGVLYRNGQKVDEPYVHLSQCDQGTPADCSDFADYSQAEKDQHIPASFKLIMWHGKLIPLDYTDHDCNNTNPYSGTFLPRIDQFPYNIAPDFALAPEDAAAAEACPAQRIPPGYFLFMGDNRNNSYDGRAWGLVPRDEIIGRSEFIWLPLSRWRITR